ncbi:hypothetical protein [Flagellimonas sp. 2504JD4-2]
MKKYIVSFITACALLVSCEQDRTIFNESQTFLKFNQSNLDLPIIIDGEGSAQVTINVSSISESERTFEVNIVEEETTAEAASYTVGSIVVPPNSYEGTLTINGVDNNVTTDPKVLVLSVPTSPDLVASGNLTVSIFQVCPVDETLFTGMYLLEEIIPVPFGPGLQSGDVLEITANGLARTFNSINFPNFCSTPIPFTFNLVCNEFVVPLQDTNCHCGDGSNYWGPSTVGHATYDITDDSVFEVNFTNDVQSNCGSPAQTTYRFTKQ